jgi:hypothetical protein
MTDADLVKIAADIRDGIIGDGPSAWMCAAISWPLAALLRFHGVTCDCVETDLGHCKHIWIRLADGRALDATADQFNHFSDCDFPEVYLGMPKSIHGAAA